MSKKKQHSGGRKTQTEIWKMPVLMAVFLMLGLLFSLAGDGVWDIVGMICLCIPLVFILTKYYSK